jgi:ABC-type amino acid transport substrate-binding protein
MEQLISTPEDLARGKVVSIKHSVSDTYLRNRRIYPLYVKNVSEGLLAIKEGSVDAMVYDAPLLHYIIKEKYPQDLMVIEALFESQNYGIALPENSPLRERINREMLEIISSAEWGRIKHKYLGE